MIGATVTAMKPQAKKVAIQTAKVSHAWETLAPTAKFAGLTLAQFKNQVQPSLDTRDTVTSLRTQLTSTLDKRHDADKATMSLNELVVNAVKGDPNFGSDSDLYDAMGFVRKSKRRSGLTRNGNGAAPIPAAATN